jgi:hypothetical protein
MDLGAQPALERPMAYSAGFSQQFLVNSESFVGDLNQSIYGSPAARTRWTPS